MDLAKTINKESQDVVRIATCTAEACTDRTMKHVRLSYNVIQCLLFIVWIFLLLYRQ